MTVFHLLYSSIQFKIPPSQKLRPKYYEGEIKWYFIDQTGKYVDAMLTKSFLFPQEIWFLLNKTKCWSGVDLTPPRDED